MNMDPKLIAEAVEDGLMYNEDYDKDFFEAMAATKEMSPRDVQPRVRRAIFRFITQSRDQGVLANGGYILMGFIHGYQVARKLGRPIEGGV